MKVTTLNKMLRSYYTDDPAMSGRINKMKRGDNSSSPDTLMSSIVNYWKLNLTAPPEDVASAEIPTAQEKKVLKMPVTRMREILLEANAGDELKCTHIKKARKGDFQTSESLVSMLAEVMKQKE